MGWIARSLTAQGPAWQRKQQAVPSASIAKLDPEWPEP